MYDEAQIAAAIAGGPARNVRVTAANLMVAAGGLLTWLVLAIGWLRDSYFGWAESFVPFVGPYTGVLGSFLLILFYAMLALSVLGLVHANHGTRNALVGIIAIASGLGAIVLELAGADSVAQYYLYDLIDYRWIPFAPLMLLVAGGGAMLLVPPGPGSTRQAPVTVPAQRLDPALESTSYVFFALGTEHGPMPAAEIRTLVATQQIRPDTMVRSETSDWFPAWELGGATGTVPGGPVSDKSWMTALLLSILVGGLGVDRFYVGHVGLGLLKLFTCGGAGIWALVDVVLFATDKVTDAQGRQLSRTS